MNTEFLTFLDSEPKAAEEKYRILRAKLVFFFEFHGRSEAEDLTHEVFVRVLGKLNEGLPIDAGGLGKYCFGVARHVLQEARKGRQGMPLEDIPGPQSTSLGGLSEVELLILREQILNLLLPSERDLLMRYYLDDRDELASELGLSENALRIRVHRLVARTRGIVR